eukprot:TRINITY_DN3961_c0_g1_i1.p1 TRINITY_DN3961_c0_g1~~TRINITY_DN3961_c0_g1_i1.p1  ORF type:complete len:543 (-),score=194.03 TRINITY_DN3961_c0_g1_i1:6-1577(-)
MVEALAPDAKDVDPESIGLEDTWTAPEMDPDDVTVGNERSILRKMEMEGKEYAGKPVRRKQAFTDFGGASDSDEGGDDLGSASEGEEDLDKMFLQGDSDEDSDQDGFGEEEGEGSEGEEDLDGMFLQGDSDEDSDQDGFGEEEGEGSEGEEDLDGMFLGAGDSDDDADQPPRPKASTKQKRPQPKEIEDDDDDEDGENVQENRAQSVQSSKPTEDFDSLLSELNITRQSTESESAKTQFEQAKATSTQQQLLTSITNLRIHLQKPMTLANRMPKPAMYQEFCNSKRSAEIKSAFKEVRDEAQALMWSLLTLQTDMFQKNEVMREVSVRKKRKMERENSLQNPSSSWEIIQEGHSKLEQWESDTINHWDQRTRGSTNLKGFSQSPIDQARRAFESDREELMTVAHTRRSLFRVLGEEASVAPTNTNTFQSVKSVDPEIFDDSDFYASLLKESAEAPTEGFLPMKKDKKAPVKRRANNKNRAVKFDVHQKLVGFMTPQKTKLSADQEDSGLKWSYEQLFQGLFAQ